jgi:hypothetical protein
LYASQLKDINNCYIVGCTRKIVSVFKKGVVARWHANTNLDIS